MPELELRTEAILFQQLHRESTRASEKGKMMLLARETEQAKVKRWTWLWTRQTLRPCLLLFRCLSPVVK